MPVNDANFLMWFADGESQFDLGLPRPFVREPEVLSPVVWLVPGDIVRFYINTTDNTAIGGTLLIVDEQGNGVAIAVQSLSLIDFPNGSHTYGSFTVPNKPEGLYRLQLGDYVTQYLWMTTADSAVDKTAVVSFRNDDRLGGAINTRWSYLSSAFFQTFRIRLAVDGIGNGTNKSTYTSSTSGKNKPLFSQMNRTVRFVTPEYDYWGHQAIIGMLEHDTIYINDRLLTFKEGYEPNMNRGDALSEGTFTMSDEAATTIKR
ncbi:hypothetical protein GCM10028805_22480 [Spirosoma harenae]